MKRINYSKLVDPDTFIGRYMDNLSEQETPHAYDFFCALWLMSLAVGRRVVVDRPRAPVYLNMYIILVAESGITRKSTAVRVATKLARRFIDTQIVAGTGYVELIESKITPEELEWRMHLNSQEYGYAHTAICIDELVRLIGREKYQLAMPGMLTDLYDAPGLRTGGGTLTRGRTTIKEVWLSFLSASTPSWLVRAVNPDVIEGGFTSRVVFIWAEKRKRKNSWPGREAIGSVSDMRAGSGRASPEEMLQRLLRELQEMSALGTKHSQVGINENAWKTFDNWYRSKPESIDPFKSSFESREDAHVLRLAALLSINDGSWQIQTHHIKAAISVIAEVKEDGASIFEGGGQRSKMVIGIDKLRDKLVECGTDTIAKSRLFRYVQNYLTNAEFTLVLEIMLELGMVQCFEMGHEGAGRPATLYRATKSIVAKGAIEEIMKSI